MNLPRTHTERNRPNQIDICAPPCQGLTGTIQGNQLSHWKAEL